MKHANRYDSINIIEDDAPVYKVNFQFWKQLVGDDCVPIYHKYGNPCSYEQAVSNMRHAERELEELAFRADKYVHGLYDDDGMPCGVQTTWPDGWDIYHNDGDEDDFYLVTSKFDSTVELNFGDERSYYSDSAYIWIEKVA